jgi:hypothetical protein
MKEWHPTIGKIVVDLIIWSIVSASLGLLFALIGGTHFDIFLNDPSRSSQVGRIVNMSFDFGGSKFFGNPYPDISGAWTLVFKEFCPEQCGDVDAPDKPQFVIDRDKLALTQWGGYVRGSLRTHDVTDREWAVVGQYRGNTLTISYEAVGEYRKINPNSAGTFVVMPQDSSNAILKGYWTGWDKDLNRIVSCPLIMTRDEAPQSFSADELRAEMNRYLVKHNLKDYMSVSCGPSNEKKSEK